MKEEEEIIKKDWLIGVVAKICDLFYWRKGDKDNEKIDSVVGDWWTLWLCQLQYNELTEC